MNGLRSIFLLDRPALRDTESSAMVTPSRHKAAKQKPAISGDGPLKLALGDAMGPHRAIDSELKADTAAEQDRLAEQAPLKLELFLPYRLNVISNLVSQALSRVYTQRYGIGVPEWRVVVTLGQYGVMTAKAIGVHAHMHKTKVSRAVAFLEKRRLLARRANRDDKREAFLSLTAAGRAMYEEVSPHALEFAQRLTDILSPPDREAFDRALRLLTERSAQLVAASGEPDKDEP
jgi:DNA-binding MarR family transcriptional regulator